MRRSFKSLPPASSLDSLVQDRTNTRTSMKLFIVSAALACFALVTACNSDALRSGSASLAVQAQTMKDEYKLSADSKKDKSKSLPLTFSHLNHATKNYSIDGKSTIGCVECHHTDQPAAEAAKHPPLKTADPADRTTTLTAETLKDAKTPPVRGCRDCHAQEGEKPKFGDAIPEVTYEGDTDPDRKSTRLNSSHANI